MDRDRFPEFNGIPQLNNKYRSLYFARGIIVVVVEPDFAPADAAWVVHCFESVRSEKQR